MIRTSGAPLKIILIGVYALLLWKGAELAHFAFLKSRVDSVVLSSPSRQAAQPAAQSSLLDRNISSWENVVGVRSDAVSASIAIKRLSRAVTMYDLEPEAISILAVRPMSAQAWILLTGARFLRGQPIEKAASALQNALMLAPNEDDLIAERLVFGLIVWEHLSPGAKERIAMDLAIEARQGAAELTSARILIASKDPMARQDIRGRLDRYPDRKSLVSLLGL